MLLERGAGMEERTVDGYTALIVAARWGRTDIGFEKNKNKIVTMYVLCMYVHLYMHYVCMYVLCMYVCTMYLCIYVLCMPECMYVCMNLCIYVLCMYVCVYVLCIYMYLYNASDLILLILKF